MQASYLFTLAQNTSQAWGAFCGAPLALAIYVPDNVTVANASWHFNTFSNILCAHFALACSSRPSTPQLHAPACVLCGFTASYNGRSARASGQQAMVRSSIAETACVHRMLSWYPESLAACSAGLQPPPPGPGGQAAPLTFSVQLPNLDLAQFQACSCLCKLVHHRQDLGWLKPDICFELVCLIAQQRRCCLNFCGPSLQPGCPIAALLAADAARGCAGCSMGSWL